VRCWGGWFGHLPGMKTRFRFLAGFALAAAAIAAMGQVAIQTFPPDSVYGRIGVGTFGPGGAIPISTLFANLGIGVTAHSVVIGKGTTIPGFNGVAPSTAGQIFIDQGSGIDPAFKPASGSCTVDINGVFGCGTIGGGVNIVSANYTVQTSDCFKTVQAGTGTGSTAQFTVTLPSPSGFPAGCPITIYNGDAYSPGSPRGKIMSGFPADIFYILFPHQSFNVGISNGAWVVTRQAGRWMEAGPQIYVSNSGSDTSNDCLSASTACATINHAVSGVLYPRIDNLNGSPIVFLFGGGTWNECDTFQGQLTGINVGFIEGTSGQATWNTVGACAALLIADNAEWETANITFTSDAANGSGIFIHQPGVVDMLSGTNFGAFSGTGAAVGSDHGGFINFDQAGGAVNIGPGNVGVFLSLGPGTQMVGSFTAVGQSPVTIGTWMAIVGAGAMANYAGIATGGSFSAIGPSTCRGPGAFTLGSSLPGGAPTATLGCQSM
jgi:hypothetical protein